MSKLFLIFARIYALFNVLFGMLMCLWGIIQFVVSAVSISSHAFHMARDFWFQMRYWDKSAGFLMVSAIFVFLVGAGIMLFGVIVCVVSFSKKSKEIINGEKSK